MVDLFFDDLFENVFYGFNRPMYERQGWYGVEKDGKVYLSINALGVSPKDIEVSVDSDGNNRQLIKVNGKTKNEFLDKEYSISIKFLVYKSIKEIIKNFENGLLTLEVIFETPVKPSVLIRSR